MDEVSAAEFIARHQQIGLGIHDGLSALVAAEAGADFVWLSGFGTSAAHGLPDAGILDAETLARVASFVAKVIRIPVVVDMDAGFGDPLKVLHASRDLFHAGASVLCIEDNLTSKRSSLYNTGKRELASAETHCARLAAAKKAADGKGRVVARTEALVAGLGVPEAISRCQQYIEHGADAVFVHAVNADHLKGLSKFCSHWAGRTPIFYAPTMFPDLAAKVFQEMGITHLIYANQLVRAAYLAMFEVARELTQGSGISATKHLIASVERISEAVGADDVEGVLSLTV